MTLCTCLEAEQRRAMARKASTVLVKRVGAFFLSSQLANGHSRSDPATRTRRTQRRWPTFARARAHDAQARALNSELTRARINDLFVDSDNCGFARLERVHSQRAAALAGRRSRPVPESVSLAQIRRNSDGHREHENNAEVSRPGPPMASG